MKSGSDILTELKYSTSVFFLPRIKTRVQIHLMMAKAHEINSSAETTALAKLSSN